MYVRPVAEYASAVWDFSNKLPSIKMKMCKEEQLDLSYSYKIIEKKEAYLKT